MISLPWVKLTNLNQTTLAPGEKITFDAVITPGADVQPGVYADRIIATDGTTQTSMVLSVEVSSANRGAISFVLTDDAGQVVKNAELTLVSQEAFAAISGDGRSSTYHNVYHINSDAMGVATLADVPVGDYDYSITAAGHESLRGMIAVMPQSDARIVELKMTAVSLSYKWTVTPIVIEDRWGGQ